TYSGSTLTITDEAGSALSATNPCCVGLPGATAGQNGTVAFTSAISSTFGATSDTDGNLFGISEANWANPMPWFIHFCRGSASNYAGLSRNPVRYETGDAAGDMCQEGDTDCDAQGDLFIMTTGLTLASEVDMPCVTVGAIRPTYATAGNAWTVSTLGDTDGIGSDRLAKTFATLWTMPVGQNGAEAGKTFTETDGATDLVFDPTNLTTYRLASTGVVSLQHYHGTQNGTGAGDSTAIRWFGPLVAAGTAGQYYSGSGFAGVNTVYSTALPNIVVGTSYVVPGYVNAAVGGSLTAAAFANTADYLIFNIDYPAF
ncbi:MAG: hypothetical protein KKB59_18530, partial [Spirochaetes bacterium]|nr:hypothetical protein [Spirochaetota bacterium]